MNMDTIYADFSISMSEFKKNPAQVLRAAGESQWLFLTTTARHFIW